MLIKVLKSNATLSFDAPAFLLVTVTMRSLTHSLGVVEVFGVEVVQIEQL